MNEPERPVRDVLRYFLRHPDAVDTIEGITRWRLMEEALQRKLEETRAAIEWLSERGFLERISVSGSEPLFKLNAVRKREAENLLGARKPGKG